MHIYIYIKKCKHILLFIYIYEKAEPETTYIFKTFQFSWIIGFCLNYDVLRWLRLINYDLCNEKLYSLHLR